MKNLLITLISVTIISNPILAESKELKMGDLAPFDGILTDIETSKKIRIELIEKDALQAQNTSLHQSIELHKSLASTNEERLKILQESNTKMYTRLEKSSSLNTVERILWFSLGVIGTSLAIKGARGLTQ